MRLPICLLFCALALTSAVAAPTDVRNADRTKNIMERTPVYFEPNLGQFDPQVRFMARGAKYQAWITDHEMVLAFAGKVDTGKPLTEMIEVQARPAAGLLSEAPRSVEREIIRIRFGDKKPRVAVGLERMTSYSNYFLGNDSKQWRSSVPNYTRVKLEEVYPGIDIVFYGKGREIEYDYILKPGADPGLISLHFDAPNKPLLDSRGNVSIGLRAGQFTHSAPVAYQGDRILRISAQFDQGSLGFRLGSFDSMRAVTIDPLLQFSTYLGGTGQDQDLGGMALDSSGNVFVVGLTASSNFPTTGGTADTTLNGVFDGFVTKFDPAGSTLLYSTYLGGSGSDEANAIAVDASGNAYVLGRTPSSNFPTTVGAYDTAFNGGEDVFVVKLNASGASLLYSTFVGGSLSEFPGSAICIDSSGNAFFTGYTQSNTFPTTAGSFDTSFNGGSFDAFVVKLGPGGSTLVYSTFLGSTSEDRGNAIAVDASGNAYVAGYTSSAGFPTTAGAFATINNGTDGFAAKLNPAGTALVYSTFLGGSSTDLAFGINVDGSGNAFVTGETLSTDFPVTSGAWDTTLNSADAYVVKLNAAGSALVYSTYLGGGGTEVGYDIKVDPSGRAYVTGYTLSFNFPTTPDAVDTSLNGGSDVFLAQLSTTGNQLLYGTFLGGSSTDEGHALALDSSGDVFVAGLTLSTNFPTTAGAWDTTQNGNYDVFVSKLFLGAIADTTPPVITPNVSPGPNSNGWNNGPVTVSWTVTDPDSTITSQSGCGTTTLSTQTPVGGTMLTCTATSSGGTASTSVTAKIDLTNPIITGGAMPSANANGWNNTDGNVNFTCSDALSGMNVVSATVPKTTEGTGQSAGYTCQDLAGNTASLTISNINIDKTVPTVTATRTPAANANGWNNTDVAASFSGTDSLSGIDSCTNLVTLSSEGPGQSVSGSCTDKAGNTSAATASGINIDKTPPSSSAAASPGPNANGWNNTDVTVSFSGTDSLSGIDSCVSPVTLSSEGAGQSASGSCTDKAGNTSTPATAGGINIDKTAPTLTFGPAPSGWNNTNVSITFTAADAMSGVASTNPGSSPLVLSTEGSAVTGTVTVTDNAGNSATFTSPAVKIDKTPPTATAAAAGTLGTNQWYTSDVVVSFAGNDGSGSGIASCTSPVTLNTDGTGYSASGTCTDSAGNTSLSASVTGINIDKTAPTLTFGPAPSGWNNTNVSITFTAADATSGVASTNPGSSPLVLSTEGSAVTGTVTVTDNAGNSATFTSTAVKIDKTVPTLNPVVSPNPVPLNGVAAVTSGAADALSGLFSQSCGALVTNLVATKSLTCTATDNAGNTNSATAAYSVGNAVVTAAITAANKLFDGTTAVVITNCTVSPKSTSDDVACNAGTANFDTPYPGPGKTVTATGVTLTGTTAGNYQLSSTTATTTAAITTTGFIIPVEVTLHTVDQKKSGACGYESNGKGKGECKNAPDPGLVVKVFDTKATAFRTAYGADPNKGDYGAIYESSIGLMNPTCSTDSSGETLCFEPQVSDYLVLVKYVGVGNIKIPSSKTVTLYAGKKISAGSFQSRPTNTEFVGPLKTVNPAGALWSRDADVHIGFHLLKTINKDSDQRSDRDGRIDYADGAKSVYLGSYLEILYPSYTVWEEGMTDYIYPFILTGDSEWTVDVCAAVPQGYQIAGVYDIDGNLVASSECVQTGVAGDTRIIAFKVLDLQSPPPHFSATLKIHHKGADRNDQLETGGYRKGKDDKDKKDKNK